MHTGTTHTSEAKEKMSQSHIGLTYPNRKRRSDSDISMKTEAMRKANIGNTYTTGLAPWNKGLKGVQKSKYKGKPMPWMQKERHPMWKGGISRFYPEGWSVIRKAVYARDKYTCLGANCKNIGIRMPLDVHHIDDNPKNNILSNLIALCRSCHVKETWRMRKIS